MGKYDSRIDSLYKRLQKLNERTSVFFSREDISLIRNHRKCLLDESNITPEDLQELFDQVNKLMKEWQKDNTIDFNQKLLELNEDSELAYNALYYLASEQEFNERPAGGWVTKKDAWSKQQLLKEAKEYIKKKRDNLA